MAGARPLGWQPWLLASRPATLPAAVVPVLVGTAAAAPLVGVRWGPFLAALLASILIQIGTNLANDVFDFRKGADTANRLGPIRVTQSGMVSPEAVLRATALVFGLAVLLGVYLVFVGGLPILVVGVLSILAGLAYTGGPWPLGYHSLGDVFVFVFFGLVAVIGSGYLQALAVSPLLFWASIPVALLVTAILVVNNLRDADQDKLVGKVTLAVRLGKPATRAEFALCVALSYLFPVGLWLAGLAGAWALLPLLTFPLGFRLVRLVQTQSGRALNAGLKGTGQLHLLFGVLFAIGLWLPR